MPNNRVSKILKRDIDFSPTDRVALFQALELKKRERIIRQVAKLLTVSYFVGTRTRYLSAIRKAGQLIRAEAERIYFIEHPPKKARRK